MNMIDTLYAGRRLSTKDTTLYVFERVDGGAPLAFGKNHVHVGIGTAVSWTETPESNSSVYVAGDLGPKIGHNDATSQQLLEWNAADRVTRQQLADIAHARKMKREAVDPLEGPIAALRDAMNSQRGWAARAALWRHIEQEVNR